MRPLVVALASAVLVLAVVAALWITSGRDRSEAAPAPDTAHGLPSQEEDAGPVVRVEEPALRSPDDSARTAIEAPAADAARRDRDPATRKRGAVVGEVQDAFGKPVAGATVLAAQGADFAFGGLPIDIVERPFGPIGSRLEATTGADGRFALEGVRAGKLMLGVRKSGFAPFDRSDVDVPTGESFDLGTLTLETGVFVDGRVVDSRGRPVAGAVVERVVEATSGAVVILDGFRRPGIRVATTGADGRFSVDQLGSGPFTLRATTEDHPDAVASGTTSRPGERASISIELDDGFEIRGHVVGAPAGETGRLSVRAMPTRAEDENGAGTDLVDFGFDAPLGEMREAKVAGDGAFAVRGLREGKNYALTLRKTGRDEDPFFGSVSGRAVARAGSSGVELRYQPESALAFTVVDARTRAPIESFEAEAGIDWRMPLRPEPGQKPGVHPGGVARFPGLRPQTPGDKASLEVRATGYRDLEIADIALTPGADTDLGVLALEPVPVVRVTVRDDATGAALSGARVTLRQMREVPGDVRGFRTSIAVTHDEEVDAGGGEVEYTSDDTRVARTNEDGVALLTSFEGDRCRVEVQRDGHATFHSEAFVAPSGASHEVEARMRRGGSVRVKLVRADGSPVAGGRVEHRSDDQDLGPADFLGHGQAGEVTDTEGVAVFEHLAAGAHRFRPEGGADGGFTAFGGATVVSFGGEEEDQGPPWSDVAVTEGGTSEITLVAPVRVELTGVVREAGTALAGATLRLNRRRKGSDNEPRLPSFLAGGPTAKTDGGGGYRFEGVTPGEYTLTVSHSTRQMDAEFELTVGEDGRAFDVELGITTIEGRVTDGDGKPVAGARVSVERAQGQGPGGVTRMRAMIVTSDGGGMVSMFGDDAGAAPVETDGEGNYVLRGVLGDVDLTVKAEAKGLQEASSDPVRVAENQARRGIDLALQRAGSIDVSAFTSDGSPARMVMITARPAGGEGDVKTGFIDAGGKTTLDGLAPGPWRLSARRVGPDEQGAGAPPEQTIEVKAGEAAGARFDLP